MLVRADSAYYGYDITAAASRAGARWMAAQATRAAATLAGGCHTRTPRHSRLTTRPSRARPETISGSTGQTR